MAKSTKARWQEACDAINKNAEALSTIRKAFEDLYDIQQWFVAKREAMSDQAREGERGQAMEGICELGIEGAIEAMDTIDSVLAGCESAELP